LCRREFPDSVVYHRKAICARRRKEKGEPTEEVKRYYTLRVIYIYILRTNTREQWWGEWWWWWWRNSERSWTKSHVALATSFLLAAANASAPPGPFIFCAKQTRTFCTHTQNVICEMIYYYYNTHNNNTHRALENFVEAMSLLRTLLLLYTANITQQPNNNNNNNNCYYYYSYYYYYIRLSLCVYKDNSYLQSPEYHNIETV